MMPKSPLGERSHPARAARGAQSGSRRKTIQDPVNENSRDAYVELQGYGPPGKPHVAIEIVAHCPKQALQDEGKIPAARMVSDMRIVK